MKYKIDTFGLKWVRNEELCLHYKESDRDNVHHFYKKVYSGSVSPTLMVNGPRQVTSSSKAQPIKINQY